MRVEDTTVPMLALRSDGSWNTARWSNEKYDTALDKAFEATSKDERAKHLKTCQQVHHKEGAWLHCAFLNVFGAAQDYVQEYEMMPSTSRSYLANVALSPEAPQGP
jgi:ABC-type transport system substrate-binding protein